MRRWTSRALHARRSRTGLSKSGPRASSSSTCGERRRKFIKGRIGKVRWESLEERIRKNGLRNSCLISPMPTASTAQIMNSYVQAFHPIPSVLYQRRTMAGDYLLVCPNFVDDMVAAGAWTPEVQQALQLCSGRVDDPSVQSLIPESIKAKYTSVWDMKQKFVVDHAVARGPFIDQTQSMELFLQSPDTRTLTNMHFYTWRKGLKTGVYYLRTQSKIRSIQFGIEKADAQGSQQADEECLNCGS